MSINHCNHLSRQSSKENLEKCNFLYLQDGYLASLNVPCFILGCCLALVMLSNPAFNLCYERAYRKTKKKHNTYFQQNVWGSISRHISLEETFVIWDFDLFFRPLRAVAVAGLSAPVVGQGPAGLVTRDKP